ncbi:hypothetical protein [uncultured Corynebacterium sp.]|uniref:hypothetical protein n=1 Tax=uncultured Corynebacterium sp. TaxID=159447 RepID=UPI002612BDD6|nr:hypothetical protein [uncultured Corynebacterium sp.]
MSTPQAAISNLWKASADHTDALIRLDDELSTHWMAIIRGEIPDTDTKPLTIRERADIALKAQAKLREAIAVAETAGISSTVIKAIIANPRTHLTTKEFNNV